MIVIQAVTEAQFTERVVCMGVVKPPATAATAMKGLMRQGILLWCEARVLPGWCCVPEGRPGAELLPLVRREGLLIL